MQFFLHNSFSSYDYSADTFNILCYLLFYLTFSTYLFMKYSYAKYSRYTASTFSIAALPGAPVVSRFSTQVFKDTAS